MGGLWSVSERNALDASTGTAEMIDHRVRQTESARRERRQLLFKDMTFEQAQAAAKEKRVPAGSVWHWSTGNMYGPIGSAQERSNAA